MLNIIYRIAFMAGAIFCLNAPAAAIDIYIQNIIVGGQVMDFRLMSSKPYDTQKLYETPKEIAITFSQDIQKEKSYIRVYNMFGVQVNEAPVQADGDILSAPLPALEPGRYRVKWQAYCLCKANTNLRDSFVFTIL
jgi:methionine-rich copper-binding protein CopC